MMVLNKTSVKRRVGAFLLNNYASFLMFRLWVFVKLFLKLRIVCNDRRFID